MEPVLPPFVDALPDGISRVSLPTPFRAGPVNCYLLLGQPVTLVDPGTLAEGSLDLVAALLARQGLRVDDVQQLVVTHAHPDHFGAAAVIAARAQAPILSGGPELPGLLGLPDEGPRRALLATMGAPEEAFAAGFGAGLQGLVAWADPAMLESVDDGATVVAGGRRFRALITPGHADGHLSLWDPAERFLISGDHLLARTMPVPSLNPDSMAAGGRRRSLVEYLAGLPALAGLEPAKVLPGHGRGFTRVDVLAQWLRDRSLERSATILDLLDGGPATVFELAGRLLWQPVGARLLSGMAHVAGHLDLLEDDGRIAAASVGGATLYRAT